MFDTEENFLHTLMGTNWNESVSFAMNLTEMSEDGHRVYKETEWFYFTDFFWQTVNKTD